MRVRVVAIVRALAVVALVALSARAAMAQPTRHFKDSWFWGIKGGALGYQIQSDMVPNNPFERFWGGPVAPLAGLDWLITRTNGGLYVSYDQSFFEHFVLVNDSAGPLDFTPGGRQVVLKDLRRFTMAGMLFPMQSYFMHPYVGFGATLSYIGKATPQGTYTNPARQQPLVEGTIAQFRSVALPVFMIGTQFRLLKFSTFGQATAIPASRSFFLFTGSGWRVTLEGGIRFNVGTSIERMQ
jgi:hypothetical protein